MVRRGRWGASRPYATDLRGVDIDGGTMQEFDPRRSATRWAPRLFTAVAGLAALGLGLKLTADDVKAPADKAALDPAALAALQHVAFAGAEAQPGFAPSREGAWAAQFCFALRHDMELQLPSVWTSPCPRLNLRHPKAGRRKPPQAQEAHRPPKKGR